jgi:hypothetical protein
VEQAEEANAEMLELLADFLPQRFPDLFTRDGDALINHATGDVWDLADKSLDPLEVSALLVQVHALSCPWHLCSALRGCRSWPWTPWESPPCWSSCMRLPGAPAHVCTNRTGYLADHAGCNLALIPCICVISLF